MIDLFDFGVLLISHGIALGIGAYVGRRELCMDYGMQHVARAALKGVSKDYAVVKKECDVYDLGDGWKADVYQVKLSSQTQES